jgi:hypothetical protein
LVILPCLFAQARTDHGFATLVRNLVEQAIREKLDGTAMPDPNHGKDTAAVALRIWRA